MNLLSRLIVFIVFIVGIYFIPWWVLYTVAFVFMLLKRLILPELLIPAFMVDTIYSIPLVRFYNFQFIATFIMVGMLGIVFLVKRYLRN